MDRNSGYRSFFGSNRRPFGRMDDGFEDFGDNFRDVDDMFAHFHEEMNKQMNQITREMDDMFRNFGSIDFSPRRFSAIEDGRRHEHPRDRMLKDPERSLALPRDRDTFPRSRPSIFGDMFTMPRWDNIRPYRRDTDLDEEVAEKSVSKIFEERKVEGDGSPMQIYSKSKNHSFSAYRGPDGFQKVEKKNQWKNPDGSMEESVTRQLGDKSHTIYTKKDKYGHEETNETLNNMDERDIPSFKEQWNKNNRDIRSDAVVPIDERDRSLFSKFFGFRPRF